MMFRQSSLERKVVVRHNVTEDLADDDEWKGSDASEDDENESDDTENEWSNNLEATEPSEEGGVDDDNHDNVGEEEEVEEEIETEIEFETKKPASVPKQKKFAPKKKSISACSKGDLVPLIIRPKKKRKKEYVIDEEGEDTPSYKRNRNYGSYAHTEEDDVDDDTDNNVERGEIEIEIETKKAASVPKKKNFVPEKKSLIPACSEGDLVPLTIRPKKRRKKEYVIDEEGEDTPTYARKTKKGGYAHTNLSKSRISQANSGNKPWNYGKRRSSADKAKIAAGVRAINRTRLLAKLQLLGMTEEEWFQKKKEIKYLRERVRRAKKANLKVETEFHSRKLQETLDTTDETKRNINGIKVGETNCNNDEERIEKEMKMKIEEQEQNMIQEERTEKILPEVSTLRPYSFSENEETDNKNAPSNNEVCDEGGPGGLICCEDCSRKYNAYLTSTMEDVEMQRINKEAEEVTEILDYLNEKKDILNRAADSAKTKIPPLPPPGSRIMQAAAAPRPRPRPNNGSSKSDRNSKYDHIDSEIDINVGDSWNLTSAIDIGITGGFFASI